MSTSHAHEHHVDQIRIELEARIALLEDDLRTTEDLLGAAEQQAVRLASLLAAAYRLVALLRQPPR